MSPSTSQPQFDQSHDVVKPGMEPVGNNVDKSLNMIEETSINGAVHHDPMEEYELYLGLSLITGFVFMLAIDQLSSSHSHTQCGMLKIQVAMNDCNVFKNSRF